MDGLRTHCLPEVRAAINKCGFDIWILPPNTTSQLQPLDLSVNKSFKRHYSILWDEWIDKKSAEDTSKPSKDRIIEWVGKAWEKVDLSTAKNGWKVLTDFHKELQPTASLGQTVFYKTTTPIFVDQPKEDEKEIEELDEEAFKQNENNDRLARNEWFDLDTEEEESATSNSFDLDDEIMLGMDALL